MGRTTGFKRRERNEEELTDLGDEIVLVHETAKALLVEIEGDERWIPKSLVREGTRLVKGEKGTLVIPEWFAHKEGLVE